MKPGKDPNELLKRLRLGRFESVGWRPEVDVCRCAEGLLVKLELAGVAGQDLRITVRADILVMECKRRDRFVWDTQKSLSMEIRYDWLQRRIRLPAPSRRDHRKRPLRTDPGCIDGW